MRVAYICADRGVPVYGRKGCSIHVQEVIRSLLAMGCKVDLFATVQGGDAPDDLAHVTVHKLPRLSHAGAEQRERFSLAANLDLQAALDATGDFDLVYERHSLWSFAAMEWARSRRVPGLLEVNAPLLDEQRSYRGLILEQPAERAVARAFGAATALLAVSNGVAEYLQSHSAVVQPVHVIPNGVDGDRFHPHVVPACPIAPGEITVGFVGTLKPWHGVDGLINAFADAVRRQACHRLLIVGDGPERANLESQIEALGMTDHVHFTGAVRSDEIPGLLTSIDIAVAPYPPLEGFYFSPLKLAEYMAAGCSVVAAEIGQVSEVLDDGVNGLLYTPGDTDALAEQLCRLADDPKLRQQLGANARRSILLTRSWGGVAARIHQLARDHAPVVPREAC